MKRKKILDLVDRRKESLIWEKLRNDPYSEELK